MSNKKIAIIGLIIFISGCLLGGVTALIENRDFRSVVSQSKNKTFKDSISSEDIDNLIINSDVLGVDITQGTGDKIEYVVYGDERSKLEANKVDNDLVLSTKTKRRHFNFFGNMSYGKIELKLPKKIFKKLQLTTDLGEVYINGSSFENANIKSDVGKTTIDSINVKDDLEIRTSVGTAEINNVKNLKNLKIKSNVGSVSVSDVSGEDLKITSDVGSVSLSNVYLKNILIKADVGSIDYDNDDTSFKFDSFNVNSSVGKENISVYE